LAPLGLSNQSHQFSTDFEANSPQPTSTNLVDSTGYPAGGLSNVGGICCGLSGPESGTRNETTHSGTTALLYSGNSSNNSGADFAYLVGFDLSGLNLSVDTSTVLSYWIYPQSSATNSLVSGNNSTCVAIDLTFSDGSNLRDSGALDQNGNRVHPAYQCNHLTLDTWNQISVRLGSYVNGKTIQRLDVGYDQPNSTGGYRGYIEDIGIADSSLSQGINSISANQALVWFQPNGWTAGYVILHYTNAGQAQLNVYMSYNSSTSRWEYTIGGLSPGQGVTYTFTYQKNGSQYDTGVYTWIHP
jgi:hypothetical protein